MQIKFDGAAQTVTGSQHLLTINGAKLLLDCGFFQGKRQESYDRNCNFPFSPWQIDAVILSHAHIDHSGNLPNLVKQGYNGPIYTTSATAHLANIMLMDAGHIQEADAEFLNKRRIKQGQPLTTPIYSQVEAAQVAQYFNPVKYDQDFEPIPGVTARLVDAGHILGSAGVVLDVEEKGLKVRLWFSGDIGRRKLPLIRDPILPDGADILIMECTYGDKPHTDPEIAYDELRQVVGRTLKRGGKVIIPAFAVGRTQEIVYALHQMIESHQLPSVPVYVDSPLAVNASDIFKLHPECFDDQTKQFIKADKHHTALGFDRLIYTRSVEQSKALNSRTDPMIIISASGMAEAGRILHHLRNNIENPRNTILIVSWQAPYTLGRRLADKEKRVRIYGEEYAVKAEVATIGGLSAHAGQDFLLEYALRVKHSVKQLYLVHGETGPAEALSEKLVEAGMEKPIYPTWQESVEIER
ncbi:MAG: MBL fold metallo-hydrolase [Anaerolineales bacterium]|nr:MBL fold metallo-hydrolase [Anaerolineae bacterium]PWB50564.1 MAG: MBL fold metallo-hydrolase [Anaerolineales bacterium]